MEIRSSAASFQQPSRRRKLPALREAVGDMVPVDGIAGEVDRDPARVVEVGGLGIGLWIGFEQHRLLVEAAGFDANDRAAVAMMIVADLRELLTGDEECRLAVRQLLRSLG